MSRSISAWKEAGWIFLLSRLLILLTTFIAISNLPAQKIPVRHCFHQFRDCLFAWKNWDANHFIDIAFHGYTYKIELTAFFPLWPLTMRVFSQLFGGSHEAVYASGLILANVFFYVALVLFYRLLVIDFDAVVSRDALFFLALGPYAIYFFVGYSESLFLLLCLATIFFLRRGTPGSWWLAGLCGFLAALTRSIGVLLLVPYLVILIQRFWSRRGNLRAHWRSFLNSVLPMALIPAGVLAYMLYLWLTLGDPFLFSSKQAEGWNRTLNFPWHGIISTFHNIVTGYGDFDRNVLDLTFTIIPILALVIGWKRISLHYSLFALAMMLFSLSYPYLPVFPLGGSPRYMLVIFPIFLLFALWSKHPRLKMIFCAVSLTIFLLTTFLFVLRLPVA